MMMIYANILLRPLDGNQTAVIVCSDKDQLLLEWWELFGCNIFIFKGPMDSSKEGDMSSNHEQSAF